MELAKAKIGRKNDPILTYSTGMVYAAQGKRAEALQTIKELESMSGPNLDQAHWIAKIYVALNEKELGLSWLENGLAAGAIGGFYKDERVWDPIRNYPRFADLLRRMGILVRGVTQLRLIQLLKMKRCPKCNRVETDDALAFCRADGAAVTSDSGSISANAGTAKFESGQSSDEIETSILPHTTVAAMSRATAPPLQQPTGATREPSRPKRRALIAGALLAAALLAVAGYFHLTRKEKAAIESIAVLPFVNESGNTDAEYLSDGMTETLSLCRT